MAPLFLSLPLGKAMVIMAQQHRRLHPRVTAPAQELAHLPSRRRAQDGHQPQGGPSANFGCCCMPSECNRHVFMCCCLECMPASGLPSIICKISFRHLLACVRHCHQKSCFISSRKGHCRNPMTQHLGASGYSQHKNGWSAVQPILARLFVSRSMCVFCF